MKIRSVAVLSVAVFLFIGIIGWMTNMPQPAALVSGESVVPPRAVALSGSLDSQTGSPQVTVDPAWLDRISSATNISRDVLTAYALGAQAAAVKYPDCSLGWNILAAISELGSSDGVTELDAIAAALCSDNRSLSSPEVLNAAITAVDSKPGFLMSVQRRAAQLAVEASP